MYGTFRSWLVTVLLAFSACEPGAERILGIDATGIVAGVVYMDRDGNRKLDPAVDGPVPRARVWLLVRGTRQVAARATAAADGGYQISGVPVGSYTVTLDTLTLGDSLRVSGVDPDEVTVSPGDTLIVMIAADRPTLPIAEARRAQSGRRVSVEGVVFSGWATFGDSTLHVADSSGVIRAVGVRVPGAVAGDSVRLAGAVGQEDGHPVLLDPDVVLLGRGAIRAPEILTTSAAALAAGGRLDSGPVRVVGDVVDRQSTAGGDLRIQIDDGSGMLDVILDRHAQIGSEVPLLPGARVDVTGVLVPNSGRSWSLKPRSTRDLVITIPLVTLAELRRLPPGRLASVEAVALNGWATFGDAIVHLTDGTGYVRAVQVPTSFVSAGDRIRVHGVVGVFNGWPALFALANNPPIILSKGQVSPPVNVRTGLAATADGGRLDAALVQITAATVEDTASRNGDFVLEVDDGSGIVEVLLQAATGIGSTLHPPGTVLDLTGLLVPVSGGRRWAVLPRSREDVVSVATARRTVPIAEARRAPVGRRISVEGVVFSGWATFADATVHVGDPTGVIRAVRVRASGAVAGDSVRLTGMVGEEDGQPVLVNPDVVSLGRGAIRTPETVTTAVAARAAGSRLDAAPVRVTGDVVDTQSTSGGDLRLQVDDGSGMLDVVLDRDAPIGSEVPLLPGAKVDATGVLVAQSGGGWSLKPRSTRDLVVTIPRVTLAELRNLPPGRLVSVEAVALNALATFGDATIHLADGSGYLRAVRVPTSFVSAGDRIRLHGVAGVSNGWPALLALSTSPPAILAKGQTTTAVTVRTGRAASADGGRLDAALVRITGASVRDTASRQADFVLEVDDDSGILEVLLEEEAGVSSSVHPIGAVLDITGLLVPLPGGRRWVLRPRSRADIVRH